MDMSVNYWTYPTICGNIYKEKEIRTLNMDVAIIATLYSYEPVIASVTKMGANALYLLVDKNPDETQTKAIEEVKKTIGKYVEVNLIKTEVYDIVAICKQCVELIDSLDSRYRILLNVSAARKTKALGLMFAGYVRADKVEKIFYITKETCTVVILPKVSFKLTKCQKSVLSYFHNHNNPDSMVDIYHSLNISRSMFYKTINDLHAMGYMDNNKITDAGRIVML